MKAVVAAFNQEKALVGAFSVITNLRMELFEALCEVDHLPADNNSYFKNVHLKLPELETLDLTGCGWVSNHR